MSYLKYLIREKHDIIGKTDTMTLNYIRVYIFILVAQWYQMKINLIVLYYKKNKIEYNDIKFYLV